MLKFGMASVDVVDAAELVHQNLDCGFGVRVL
jgi:hypothetical protein